MTPEDFISKWSPGGGSYGIGERAGAQPHFRELCRLLGVDSPDDTDNYTFEKGTLRLGQKRGFADVFKRGCFGWEYKAPGGDLTAALRRSIILSFGMRCSKKTPSPLAGEGGGEGLVDERTNVGATAHAPPHPSPLPRGERGQNGAAQTVEALWPPRRRRDCQSAICARKKMRAAWRQIHRDVAQGLRWSRAGWVGFGHDRSAQI